MHVLVTGGAGFIGAHSVVELASHGHRCTVIDDLSAGSSDGLRAARESVDLVTTSILDPRALDEASCGCTAILHLAAQVSVVESLRDPARSAATNQRIRDGEPPIIYGDGRQTRDFIAVEDVARANRFALEADAKGVLNVASGTAVTLLDLVKTLSTLTGKPITPIHSPARPGDVRMSAATVDRAARLLGLAATVSLTEGLRRLLEEPPVSPAGERADVARGRARS